MHGMVARSAVQNQRVGGHLWITPNECGFAAKRCEFAVKECEFAVKEC
jgi:hypothetical protein